MRTNWRYKTFPTHLKLSSLPTSMTLLILRLLAGADSILHMTRITMRLMRITLMLRIKDDLLKEDLCWWWLPDDPEVLNLKMHNSKSGSYQPLSLAPSSHRSSLDRFRLMMSKKSRYRGSFPPTSAVQCRRNHSQLYLQDVTAVTLRLKIYVLIAPFLISLPSIQFQNMTSIQFKSLMESWTKGWNEKFQWG